MICFCQLVTQYPAVPSRNCYMLSRESVHCGGSTAPHGKFQSEDMTRTRFLVERGRATAHWMMTSPVVACAKALSRHCTSCKWTNARGLTTLQVHAQPADSCALGSITSRKHMIETTECPSMIHCCACSRLRISCMPRASLCTYAPQMVVCETGCVCEGRFL